jgi:hypothetical protein
MKIHFALKTLLQKNHKSQGAQSQQRTCNLHIILKALLTLNYFINSKLWVGVDEINDSLVKILGKILYEYLYYNSLLYLYSMLFDVVAMRVQWPFFLSFLKFVITITAHNMLALMLDPRFKGLQCIIDFLGYDKVKLLTLDIIVKS